MNKLIKILLLTAGLCTLTSCGRETVKGTGDAKQEIRNLEEFTGLNVSGNYQILGSPGSPEKFIISTNANLLPYIETSVKDGNVIVETKKKTDLSPTVTQNIWFTAPKFNNLILNGSSVFQFQDLETDKLTINLSGSHQLLLTGKGDSLELTISGSSDVDARSFVTDDATIVISGSSTVYVNPAKTLKVTINGEGKVVYFSSAPKVEQAINGAGQVISNFGKLDKDVPKNEQKY